MEQINFISSEIGKKNEIISVERFKLVELSEVVSCLASLKKPESALNYKEGFFRKACQEKFKAIVVALNEALGYESFREGTKERLGTMKLEDALREISRASKNFANVLRKRFKRGASFEELKGVLSEYSESDVDLLVRCAYCLKEVNNGLAAHFLRRAIQLKTLKAIITINEQRNWDGFHIWMSWFQDTFEESSLVRKMRVRLAGIIDAFTKLKNTSSFEAEMRFETGFLEALLGYIDTALSKSCCETSEQGESQPGKQAQSKIRSQALHESLLRRVRERISNINFRIELTKLASSLKDFFQGPTATSGFLKVLSRQFAEVVWEALQARLKVNSQDRQEALDSAVVTDAFSDIVLMLRLSFKEARALFEEALNHLVDILSGEVRDS